MSRAIQEGRAALERTSASLARSNQIAIETEHIGNDVSDGSYHHCTPANSAPLQVLSDLGQQRESLLRSQRGLESTNVGLSKSQVILRAMRKNVLYNKFILILIIIFEIVILAGGIYLKFIK